MEFVNGDHQGYPTATERADYTNAFHNSKVSMRVALMSCHTQRSCGHEWEGKRGRIPVPAAYIYICVYIYVSPGRIYVAAGGAYNLSLLVYMVNVYCDFTSLYLYVYIFFFHRVN